MEEPNIEEEATTIGTKEDSATDINSNEGF